MTDAVFDYGPGGEYETKEEAYDASKKYYDRSCARTEYAQNVRCTHCDRDIPPDDRVPLDEPGECLCLSCNDRLKEELDDFTSNH